MMKQQNLFYLLQILPVFIFTAAGVADDYPVLGTSDVVTIYFGVELDGSEAAPPFTMPVSHTDIEIGPLFSGWDIYLDSDTAGAVDPNDGLFALDETHRYQLRSVPSSLAFLGTEAGRIFWYYHNPPYPGFDSEAMDDESNYLWAWNPNDTVHCADFSAKWLKVQLIDVRGPENGYVSMWQENLGTPIVFFSTFVDGITPADVYYIEAKQHSHNNWAFTQPGLYEVDLQVSTYYACDGALTGDLTNDCVVDLDDYAVLGRYWLRTDCSDPNNCGMLRLTDPNEIDINDLSEVTGQWLLCGSPFDSECP